MDLVQRYIEDKIEYEIDDWFYQQLSNYSVDEATLMVGQTLSVLSELPKEDGWTQELAGVIKGKDPLFFRIEYLNEDGHVPVLIDVNEIEVDEYLDFIIESKSIKSYANEERNRETILQGGAV